MKKSSLDVSDITVTMRLKLGKWKTNNMDAWLKFLTMMYTLSIIK